MSLRSPVLSSRIDWMPSSLAYAMRVSDGAFWLVVLGVLG
jgi:hypothetical protein